MLATAPHESHADTEGIGIMQDDRQFESNGCHLARMCWAVSSPFGSPTSSSSGSERWRKDRCIDVRWDGRAWNGNSEDQHLVGCAPYTSASSQVVYDGLLLTNVEAGACSVWISISDTILDTVCRDKVVVTVR